LKTKQAVSQLHLRDSLFFYLIEYLVLQGTACGVLVHVAANDQNTLNKAPDACYTAGNQREDKLDHSLLGKAKIEVVNAVRTQEDAQQTCNQLGFQLAAYVCGLGVGGTAASAAYNGTGSGLIAAVGAKTVACSFLEAALLTCNGLGGQFFSAILTKHGDVPAFSSVF
jgi:hypothetical protein